MSEAQFIGTGSLAAALAQGERLLAREPEAAAAQAREILSVKPGDSAALRLLGRALRAAGKTEEAERAEVEAIEAALGEAPLAEAALAASRGHWHDAETLVRRRLAAEPGDAAAIAMLAEIAAQAGALAESERLFGEALRLAPRFTDARLGLARILHGRGRIADSLAAADAVLHEIPDNVAALTFKGGLLGQTGAYDEALALYEGFLAGHGKAVAVWLAYGHVLKTVGRRDEGIAAYRRALALDPACAEAWWSLADLKISALGPDDVRAMTALLEGGGLEAGSRLHLHFALAQALEAGGNPEAAFRHYSQGNRLRREALPYDAAATHGEVARAKALFTAAFFEARPDHGDPSPAPIFIVGLPRSGSTLIEQILASHSAIEGTAELPYIPALIQELAATRSRPLGTAYPELLARLDAKEACALGQAYLERARLHRRLGRPFFIDKLPNNWLDVGFIHLILPKAKIIDARRHPLACCMSNFRQHFAQGQAFAYSLEDLGRYYRGYLDLMAHFDRTIPGLVHRVVHERLIDDPEGEVRRLLDHLQLPFEAGCLRFHENARPVRTASSEQVRRPISRDGIDQWRKFEPWLEPLKRALGPALETYPEAPGAIAQ